MIPPENLLFAAQIYGNKGVTRGQVKAGARIANVDQGRAIETRFFLT